VTWIYRESICIYLFLKAASDPTVKWRNGKYRLRYGGLAEEIIDNSNKQCKSTNDHVHTLKMSKSNSSLISSKNEIKESNSAKNLITFNSSQASLLLHSTASTSSNQHKRTNSYSMMMSSNQAELKRSNEFFSSNSDLNKQTINRSHHQHHHSISGPDALVDLKII
jgi:hypothetical protein